MHIDNYGVTETAPSDTALDNHLERLFRNGYTVLDSNFNDQFLSEVNLKVKDARQSYESKYGIEFLKSIDESHSVRAPFLYDPIFLEIAFNKNLMQLISSLLGDGFILNQQNLVINPAGEKYNQLFWHRDLPYQHFTSSRPIALNALFCLVDFTAENGGTTVLPSSHKHESFPSEGFVRESCLTVKAKRGQFIVMDAMTFHSGTMNNSEHDRVGLNNVYAPPIIKRQIELDERDFHFSPDSLSEHFKAKLGLNYVTAHNIYSYLKSRVK